MENSTKRYPLTEEQKLAVESRPGPNLVVAGAGTGKTSVIAYRYVHLVEKEKINPERILCVTFTNKAVKNLKDRIISYLPPKVTLNSDLKIHVYTFHALCKQILQTVWEKKKEPPKTIYSDFKCISIIKEILVNKNTKSKNSHSWNRIIKEIRWISKSRSDSFTKDDIANIGTKLTESSSAEKFLERYPYKEIRTVFNSFNNELKKRNLMTMDDMLLDANKFLKNEKEILEEWSAKFDEILCDEFQDVDAVQLSILYRLTELKNRLFCVGDPDQAIYGFRGAEPNIFRKIQNHFSSKKDRYDIEIKKLQENFRSTPEILNVANALMNTNRSKRDNAIKKELRTSIPSGLIPTFSVANTPKEQAQLVLEDIRELHNQGVPLSDMVVLGRNKSHYQFVKNAFLGNNVFFEDWGEVLPFMRKKEIKELIHWINVGFLEYPKEDFREVYDKPKIGVGFTTMQRILAKPGSEKNFFENLEKATHNNLYVKKLYSKYLWIKETAENKELSLADKCAKIAEISGILDFYKETNLSKYDTLINFLSCRLITSHESWTEEVYPKLGKYLTDISASRVVCTTIHSVKGLEFPHVFIVSLAKGSLPSIRGVKIKHTPEALKEYEEEEKRVLYVAITRAQKTLHVYASKGINNLSMFVDPIRGLMKDKFIAALAPTKENIGEEDGTAEEKGQNDEVEDLF